MDFSVSGSDYYPNFSRYYSQRSDPAFRRVIEDTSARNALFEDDDDKLAANLRKLFKTAGSDFFDTRAGMVSMIASLERS